MVDDEKVALTLFARLLALNGIEAKTAADGASAVDLGKTEKFDIIFLDISLPGISGFELIKSLKVTNPKSRYVMMTGYSADEFETELKDSGVADFLEKPFQISSVLACIDKVCAENK